MITHWSFLVSIDSGGKPCHCQSGVPPEAPCWLQLTAKPKHYFPLKCILIVQQKLAGLASSDLDQFADRRRSPGRFSGRRSTLGGRLSCTHATRVRIPGGCLQVPVQTARHLVVGRLCTPSADRSQRCVRMGC